MIQEASRFCTTYSNCDSQPVTGGISGRVLAGAGRFMKPAVKRAPVCRPEHIYICWKPDRTFPPEKPRAVQPTVQFLRAPWTALPHNRCVPWTNSAKRNTTNSVDRRSQLTWPLLMTSGGDRSSAEPSDYGLCGSDGPGTLVGKLLNSSHIHWAAKIRQETMAAKRNEWIEVVRIWPIRCVSCTALCI